MDARYYVSDGKKLEVKTGTIPVDGFKYTACPNDPRLKTELDKSETAVFLEAIERMLASIPDLKAIYAIGILRRCRDFATR